MSLNYARDRGESGSALVYILIAIALLAALTVSFMEPSSQQTQSQNTFKVTSELDSQASFIRSSIQECVLTYPGGDDNAIPTPQDNHPYPLMPDETFYNTQCGAGETAANNNVQHLRCAGNPGDDPCHVDIFGGLSGKFLPPAPDLFGSWQYYNGDDGVFFYIATDKTDPYLDSVLEKLDSGYSLCEADAIDATGGAVAMTSDIPGVNCANNTKCL